MMMLEWDAEVDLPADVVSITLLLLAQGIEVLLDLEPDGRRRGVRKVVCELRSVHLGRCS
jgi:hypothetical protein